MLDPGQRLLADSAMVRFQQRLRNSVNLQQDHTASPELPWLSTPAHIKGRLLPTLERTGAVADIGQALHAYWRTQG
eukprot:11209951-Lingulodinium_polyedra.AAC.1